MIFWLNSFYSSTKHFFKFINIYKFSSILIYGPPQIPPTISIIFGDLIDYSTRIYLFAKYRLTIFALSL